MTENFFRGQVQRLIIRFGQKNFDQEFINLVWREVRDLSDSGFTRFCDVMIGSRSPLKPPLLSEFREARLNEEKLKFQNDVKGASQFLQRKAPDEMRGHLRAVLSKEFGGVESVIDALEIARLKLKTDKDGPGAA